MNIDREDIVHLEIDLEDAPEVIDVIVKKKEAIDEEIKRKQVELDALVSKAMRLGSTLERLRPTLPVQDGGVVVGRILKPRIIPKLNGYDISWSIWQKVQYILKKQIRPLSKSEIIAEISILEPRIQALAGKRKRSFSVSVSSCLTTKAGLGKLNKIEQDGEDNKYSLPQTIENE